MSQTSKYSKIVLIAGLSLVLGGLVMACGTIPAPTPVPQPTRDGVEVANVPPPTPTTPAEPTLPPAIIAPDDGCVECHTAEPADADAFSHYGETIATVVTPLDCARCHGKESHQFQASHHAKAGNILASLDNFLAETVEGHRAPFNPHGGAIQTPAGPMDKVNGMSSAYSRCQQ